MFKQAQIKNGVVQGTWQSDQLPFPVPPDDSWTFVDITDRPDGSVQPLMTYDAETESFGPAPAQPDYGRTVSVREFLLLFTLEERKAIRAAAALDADVADWYAIAVQANGPIRLTHPTTLAGLTFLVAKGLLTVERRNAITNA